MSRIYMLLAPVGEQKEQKEKGVIITVRKRSCGKAMFYTCLSVIKSFCSGEACMAGGCVTVGGQHA